jgi:hypothetical protein
MTRWLWQWRTGSLRVAAALPAGQRGWTQGSSTGTTEIENVTLWRPTGPDELALVEAPG